MAERGSAWLERLERAGNALPHPVTLFAGALGVVLVVSQIAAWAGWSLRRPAAEGDGEVVAARGLLEPDGLWWLLSGLVDNFMAFPPLGVVLVAMLGIGVAERSGLLPALLERLLRWTPGRLLTPAVVLLGILSSVGLDAGYVVLPPLAAALYHAAGRPPLAGLAAAFAGVSAGFSANLGLTALDPMLAGLTESGARIIDPDYAVAVTANWYLMVVSTVVLTAVGWFVGARFVEPRQRVVAAPGEAGGDSAEPAGDGVATGRGLLWAGVVLAALALCTALAVAVPGAPLHGPGEVFPRWVEAMVPLLLLYFLLPGIAYGIAVGRIRSDADLARMLGDAIAAMAPYIVLAFVAAQFIEAFNHSQLGLLLAIAGGQGLATLELPAPVLALAFLVVAMGANLVMGSASAKYALLAPVFVPMLMQAGLAPELTQAAYRIGDSVTNVVTPLNPYWVILLAFVQRWQPGAGIGTLLALMIPYALGFALCWPLLLLVWIALGLPPGPGAP